MSAYKTLKAVAGSAGFGTTKLLVPDQTMEGARRSAGLVRDCRRSLTRLPPFP